MPSYWWVNHNQTARQEIEGQYLWSPKFESNGARSQFYDNMRLADPGDLVLSYSEQAIRYVGRVADFAFTAPKPAEFGSTGQNWSAEGWLLPVYWTELRPPVRPRSILPELAPLLPAKYSPVQPQTGYGNQKAYLAMISREAFQVALRATAFDSSALVSGGANSLTYEIVTELLEDAVERQIESAPELTTTERDALVRARRGQGRFRKNVESVERSCRLTGITNPALLIASHIKPWRLCSSASERLDGMNGLLLTPDADHLFDRGFISFTDDGEVMVSRRVDRFDLRRLGFEQLAFERFGVQEAPAVWRTDEFAPAQCGFLDFHRHEVFVS